MVMKAVRKPDSREGRLSGSITFHTICRVEQPMDWAFAVWETLYSTVIASVFAYLIGLPLGVVLVTGARDGIRPLPGSAPRMFTFTPQSMAREAMRGS